jgi:sensor histidine kinase YesM
MEFVWYLFFSTLETFAALILMIQLFRYQVKEHFPSIVVTSVLFAVLSYALRVELDFNDYFPVITLLTFAIFAFYILKIPLFWSVVASLITNTASFVIQAVLFLSFHVEETHETELIGSMTHLLQFLFAAICLIVSNILYSKGIGFAFNFDKFRSKIDNLTMLLILIVSSAALLITFFKKNVFYGAADGLMMLGFLLFMALKKERADID